MDTSTISPADRVQGCLLGGALGDALGYPVEFSRWADIRERYGPGGLSEPAQVEEPLVVSDDTQLTLYTVDGLLEALEWANDGVQADETACLWLAYLRWLKTQGEQPPSSAPAPPPRWIDASALLHHRRAPGNACLSGLATGDMGTLFRPVNQGSKGCGTVMRSAPIGLLPHMPQEGLARLAINASALTHGHPAAHHSASVFALLINDLVHGGAELGTALEHAVERGAESGVPELGQRLQAAVDLPAQSTRNAIPDPAAMTAALGEGWVAEEALAIAVYAVRQAERQGGSAEEKFRTALIVAVNHDGDSDSTGSIAGNIMGAAYGTAALPEQWPHQLDATAVVTEAATRFIRLTGLS